MKTGLIRLLLVAALSAVAHSADKASDAKTGHGSAGAHAAKVTPTPVPKAAPRERTVKASPAPSEPDHERSLRKARALADEVERVLGMPLALSENDPKELATEIKAMEIFLRDNRKGAQIRATPSVQTERSSASEQAWQKQEAERATVQQRQSEIERMRTQRDTQETQRQQQDRDFRRRQ